MKRGLVIIGFLGILGLPFFAFAQVPVVNSFVASRSSINSGELIGFSWDLSSAGGYSFVIYCVPGMKIKYTSGAAFTCDIPETSTLVLDDARDFQIYNVSGSSVTLRARITPKDSFGVDDASAAREVTVAVAAHAKIIASFAASPEVPEPFAPITLSWSAPLLDGVNLRIECVNDISARSASYTAGYYMPCNKPIFIPDLTPSGNVVIQFSNAFSSSRNVKATLLPAISPGSYDGTHEVSLDLTIPSDILPDPVMTWFSASSSVVTSGEPIVLSWTTQNASGINMRLSCDILLTATSSQNPEVALPCDKNAFSDMLVPSGSLTLSFTSPSTQNRTMAVTAIPAKKRTETYDATRSRVVLFIVKPKSVAIIPLPPPLPPPPPRSGPPPVIPPRPPDGQPPVAPAPTSVIFTQNMSRGSRLSQVISLQRFLALNPEIYPEGTVSGYFGAFTEKAVQRFQKKYGIASSGTSVSTGFGATGPKTRSKLNSLQKP